MNLDSDIIEAIDRWAQRVRLPMGADFHAWPLLAAFAFSESSWGLDRWKAKPEKAYLPGGALHRRHVVSLYEMYGDLACRSWGWAQTMYPTAYELGFTGHPWELTHADTGAHYLVEYLNRRALSEWPKAPRPELVAPARTVEEVGDAYNSGTHRDANTVPEYRERIRYGYDQAAAWARANGRVA